MIGDLAFLLSTAGSLMRKDGIRVGIIGLVSDLGDDEYLPLDYS